MHYIRRAGVLCTHGLCVAIVLHNCLAGILHDIFVSLESFPIYLCRRSPPRFIYVAGILPDIFVSLESFPIYLCRRSPPRFIYVAGILHDNIILARVLDDIFESRESPRYIVVDDIFESRESPRHIIVSRHSSTIYLCCGSPPQ